MSFDIKCRGGLDCRADTAVLTSQVISDDTICSRLEIGVQVGGKILGSPHAQ